MSCPQNGDGLSNGVHRTRQAGPSEREGHACHARSEGHVYRARWSKIDDPMLRSGPDKRVPPTWEGHACHARRMGMGYQTVFIGPDKRVPPRGHPIFRHTC